MINKTSESASQFNDNKNINEILTKICLGFTNELENNLSQPPLGCCYLLGHCLAIGLQRAGFLAKEVTGELILKDKNERNVVYGNDKRKGMLIGYYHTWCVLEYKEQKIIIDPSLKYNKIALRREYNIKLNKNIPDILVTNESKNWLFTFNENQKYIKLSKDRLSAVNPNFVEHLTQHVSETANILFARDI